MLHSQLRFIFFSAISLAMCLTISFAPFERVIAAPDADGRESTEEEDENFLNVFLPAPRELRQKLSRAEKALAENRFNEAVDELGRVLVDPQAEDYFIGSGSESGTRTSIKLKAQQMIGGMSAKGREEYERQFGPEARALLESSVLEGNVNKLTDVTRKYFHTKAGYEATMLLGRYHLDQGRPLAGALCFKRIVDTPAARDRFDPEPSLMLAVCWLHANMPEKATAALVALKERRPNATVRAGGEDVKLFDAPADALAWLNHVVGALQIKQSTDATQWTMFRGDHSRNARSSGGLPMPNVRWAVPVCNDPPDETAVEQLSKNYLDQDLPALPAMQPLAVENTVLMRTPYSVLGVDFNTGKRTWEFPWDHREEEFPPGTSGRVPQVNGNSARSHYLNQRLWDDAAFGEMSSDGKNVYVLDEVGFAANSGNVNPFIIGARGQRQPNPLGPRSDNKLVALDLSRQGALRWVVGSASGEDEPKLAGAFFLGPPMPFQGQLYALAEINSEIRLVVLDSKTGSLIWWQQLAHVENSPIPNDGPRRLAGASPSFADGILVCPTSAGAVVAVELSTRSLRWGYQYPQAQTTPRHIGFGQVTHYDPRPVGNKWADGTVTIADGRVLLTPVESEHIHCLDLLSGENAWPEKIDRHDLLYLACVHNGKVVFVGRNHVKALDLNDGKQVWQAQLDNGAMPSGRGFYSDHYFYVPTSDEHLVTIDLDNGEIVANVKTDGVLGNLICYKGDVISHGVDRVKVFHQEEPLRNRVNSILDKDPNNIWALTRQGELLLNDGRQKEALAVLRRAHAMKAGDDEVKDLLFKTLLATVEDTLAADEDVLTEIEALIDQPEQQAEYLRLRASAMQRAGNLDEAFRTLMALAGQSENESELSAMTLQAVETVTDRWRVRRDRWITARLNELLQSATSEQRAKIDAAIQARLHAAMKSEDERPLRQFVGLFGKHASTIQARLAWAARLADSGETLEAEMLLASLLDSNEADVAAHAAAQLARLLESAGRYAEAASYYRALATKWADVECAEGATGRQLFDAVPPNGEVGRLLREGVAWASGRAHVDEDGERVDNFPPAYQRVYPTRVQQADGPLGEAISLAFDSRNQNLLVKGDRGELLASVVLSQASNRAGSYRANYHLSRAKISGHLLVLSTGYELIAIDLLRAVEDGSDAILWRRDLGQVLNNQVPSIALARTNLQIKQEENPWGATDYVVADPSGRLIGASGLLSERGFCFIQQRELVCVDPITGDTLWSRDDAEAGSDVFGNDHYVFVVSPDKNEAKVYNLTDGSLVNRRDLSEHANRWTTLGRNVLSWKNSGETLDLRLYDPLDDRQIWSRTFPVGSRGWLVGLDEVAVLQPNGDFVIMSLSDDRPRLEAKVDSNENLLSIYVLRSSDQYVLITNEPITKPIPDTNVSAVPSGYHSPMVNGRVYAFDRQTGESMWTQAATVAQFSLPLDQPSELPVLLFLRHLTGTSPRRTRTSLLCIDRRDGRELVRNDDIRSPTNSYAVVGNLKDQRVVIQLPGKNYTVRFTDEPQPPAPPADAEDAQPDTGEDKADADDANGRPTRKLFENAGR